MPKRKAGDLPKYYAVRVGVAPGVYRSWAECQAQITGHPGATFKSFETEEDALAFVAGQTPPGDYGRKAKAKQADKFYAVARGKKPGIYTDWDTAQNEAIIGVKAPKYKKFATRAEAENFIRREASPETIKALGLWPEDDDDDDEEEDEDGPPVGKKVKVEEDKAAGVEVIEPTQAPEAGLHDGVLQIYTDGSALGNGKANARGGVGVFFGHGDSRNISERLEGEPTTNQRAELTAILRALEVAPVNQSVKIVTDSSYSINCVSVWSKNWARNGWKSAKGVDVLNQDLIKGILAKIGERDAQKVSTTLSWVKGHAQDPGNIAADALAVKGARGW